MRIGAAFLKARDNKEDRIQKRRSDNMAAFNSYVKTQSELGVDASVEDLEGMKRNLAGGDFFYGKSLPSENVINETSSRLGAIQADKQENERSTVLGNESASIANMQSVMSFYEGSDPNDTKTWNSISQKGPFAAIVKKFGPEQAKKFLRLTNEKVITNYMASRNVSQYVTQEGIDGVVSQSPLWMQEELRANMESNRRTYIRNAHEKATTAIGDQHAKIFGDITVKADAIAHAVNLYTRSLPSDVPVDPTFLDRVRENATSDYVLWQSGNLGKAQTYARGLDFNKDLYSNGEALNAEVISILDKYNIDPKELGASGMAVIRNIVLSGSQNALTTYENEQTAKLLSTITLAPKSDYDWLDRDETIEEHADTLMGTLGFDFSRVRWKDMGEGNTLTAKDLLKKQIVTALTSASTRDNILEARVDVTNYQNAVRARVDDNGGQTYMAELIQRPYDQNTKEKVFTEVNRLRGENNLSPYASMNEADPSNKSWANDWAWFSDQIGNARVGVYDQTVTTATETADKIVLENEAAVTNRLAALAESSGGKDSIAYKVLQVLNASYGIQADQIDDIIEAISRDISNKDIDPAEDLQEFNQTINIVAGNLGLVGKETYRADFKRTYIATIMDGKSLVKPGQSVTEYASDKVNILASMIQPYINAMQSLSPDDNPATIAAAQAQLNTLIDTIETQRKVIRIDLQTPQVGEVLNMQDEMAGLGAMRVMLDDLRDKVRAAKPSKEPDFLIWNRGKQGYTVIDSDDDIIARAENMQFQVGGVYVRDPSSPTGFKLKNAEELVSSGTENAPVVTAKKGSGVMPDYTLLSPYKKPYWESMRGTGSNLVGTTADAQVFDAIGLDPDGAKWVNRVNKNWLDEFQRGYYRYDKPQDHNGYTRKLDHEPRNMMDFLEELETGHIRLGNGPENKKARKAMMVILQARRDRASRVNLIPVNDHHGY